jgi:hypothetical protein
MSFVEVEPNKDPRSFEHTNPNKKIMQKNYEKRHQDIKDEHGPTEPWLPSKQEEQSKKSNPRAPRTEEKAESAQDLYEKAKKQHEESMAAKEEERLNGGNDEGGYEGASFDFGGSKSEKDVTAYTRFYSGPHSMFQLRKEQPQFNHQEEE